MNAPEWLKDIETKDVKLQAEVAPSVFAFGSVRPMGRIRAYSSAGLGPFAQRAQSEFVLLGHVHLDAAGKVTRLEGFNGGEGERWARAAQERLAKESRLADAAVVQPLTPLRGCPHSGVR